MKKKLKDLTIGEILTICENNDFHTCIGGECKIDCICGLFRMYEMKISVNKEYLEGEIDI